MVARLRRHWLAIAFLIVVVLTVARFTGNIAADRWQASLDEKLDQAGAGANAEMLDLERTHLTALRGFAFASGFPEALAALDIARIEQLLTPVDANLGVPMVDILDPEGRVVFAFRAEGEQPPIYRTRADVGIVARALRGEADEFGERYSTLLVSDEGPLVAGSSPVRVGDRVVGAVLVMTPLERVLDAVQPGSFLTVYTGASGVPLATTAPVKPRTLPKALQHLLPAESLPVQSSYDVPGGTAREQLGALVIRHQPIAWLGAAGLDRSDDIRFDVRLVTVLGLLATIALAVIITVLWTRFDGEPVDDEPADDLPLGALPTPDRERVQSVRSGRQRW